MTAVLLGCLCVSCSDLKGAPDAGITIVSYLVRDSVILLERMEMRSRILVGFRVRSDLLQGRNCSLNGELYHNESLMARASLSRLDGPAGSLEFDLPGVSARPFSREEPYSIPEGTYLIAIRLTDGSGNVLAERRKILRREELCRTFPGPGSTCPRPRYRLAAAQAENDRLPWHPSSADRERGYALFRTNPLERVFPDTLPAAGAAPLESIVAAVSRNEIKPITFSIRSVSDLGRVMVAISPVRGTHGVTNTVTLKVASLGLLTETAGDEEPGTVVDYRLAPRILEPEFPVVRKDVTRSFRLNLRAAADARPGEYRAVVTITPERGLRTEIPFQTTVLPITLTDTNIRYGMMMDYAFYELDSPAWTEWERELLVRRGTEIYRDLREHGMTMAYPHSRFVYATDRNGEPVLESLRNALRSYRELGFPGPFCWYMGHLLHTAKPKHPGSILLYDEAVAERRLRSLLRHFERLAREAGVPRDKLLVQLVDEPDQDDRARVAAAKRLHAVARELGFRTLITRPWPEVSVMCTGTPESDAEAVRLRSMGNEWWIYPNEALTGRNLCYTRYVFGFGAWKWGVNGVVPWTYQMSRGSNGNPFTVLDGPEIMVAYPGADGPLPTPVWEAIRDGITDYRYIYRLERLIAAKRRNSPRAAEIERRLAYMKHASAAPPHSEEGRFGDWAPESFDRRRNDLVAWVRTLSVEH